MKITAMLTLLTTLLCSAASSQDAAANKSFMALSDAQRYWFLEGAVRTVSHLVSMSDQKKGECAANWYLKDRDAKRALIEKTIAANPDRRETTVILGLLTQACGPLALKSG